MPLQTSYELLPATDTDERGEWDAPSLGHPHRRRDKEYHKHDPETRSAMYWAFAAALLCSLLNITVIGYKSIDWKLSTAAPQQVEYASTYMGLDKTYRDPAAPPLPPITSFPVVIAQTNASRPHAVSVDTHSTLSRFGTFYPEDRRVLLSSTESTFVQFWAGDFGMERCALKAVFPSSDLETADTFPFGGSSAASVEIWKVRVERPLDVHTLSHANRPSRQSLFASWDLKPNQTLESPEFSCPSSTFQTFEMACSDCRVDFRQTPAEKNLGFWLVQRTSI